MKRKKKAGRLLSRPVFRTIFILLEQTHDLVDDAEQYRFFFQTITVFILRRVLDERTECCGMSVERCQITGRIDLDELSPVAAASRPRGRALNCVRYCADQAIARVVQ